MSSGGSSSDSDSGALVRKSMKNVDRLIVPVSRSASPESSPGVSNSENDDRATSSLLRRPGQTTNKGDGSSEEEHTPLAALKRRKVEAQSDLKTARARKESLDQAQKKEAERIKKMKRKEQLEALKTVPVFGLGPGRCPSIKLDRHDDKPSSSTLDGVLACGSGRNWPRIEFVLPGSDDRPWAPPEDHLCVYECFFDQGGLGFPIPPVIME